MLEGGALPLFAAGIAGVVVGAAFLRHRWVARIRRLNEALRVQREGEVSVSLESSARDELGDLTRSIDSLVRSLRERTEEIRSEDELRRRLVANVSHELRTPLTSIQGYLETAVQAGPDSPDFARNLEVCLREAKKLTRLVQDLFQLSKLDTQQLEFQFEVVSLVEIADQVGLAFEQRMADKEVEFVTEFPDEALDVLGDGNRLAQVITNLLGNAAVFTPKGGRVLLRCERDGDKAVCSVSDTGIGIGEKDLPHIFESFFHLEKSRTRNLGGTGLGLAICKAIVDSHEGKLEVDSKINEGTTFRFALHLSAEAPED
ncbi:MAG: hypothetical protein DHS20C15_08570 [Planctomycetota bacterium]|nr:MAG: hypothetical protein DHS20C15_08570 [Planctomycetota bacterium]